MPTDAQPSEQSISEEFYRLALGMKAKADAVIRQYHREQDDAFQERLRTNPVFADDELRYSASTLCPCGHGIAYPKACGPRHYWDCSAVLKGIEDKSANHTERLSFLMYEIKSESEEHGTTRGIIRPKPESAASEQVASELPSELKQSDPDEFDET